MTAEELYALPQNDRLDRRLIQGRLVERPYPFRCPAHAAVVANLHGILGKWKRTPAGSGWGVYGYGCPYRLTRNPDTLVCYDSSIVPESVTLASPVTAPFINGRPTLAIEVIDLSDSVDALVELVELTELGIPLLWLIDPLEEYVEVHRPGCGTVILDGDDELVADFVGPGLRFPVSELFE
jgi:Uma2 family endonuclease